MRFSQVRLLVDDFGAAFRFYRDVLGLTPRPATRRAATRPSAPGRAPWRSSSAPTRAPSSSCAARRLALTVLEVDDVDAVVERLREHVVATRSTSPSGAGASPTCATRRATCSSSSRSSRPPNEAAALGP